jgi:hypothetical protein
MAEKIEFTSNYNDLSTDQGFQFEVRCDRCGTGYRSQFKQSAVAAVSGALDTASSLFGGLFGRAADLGERARSAAWEQAHDRAFMTAMADLKEGFVQCPRCQSWVCKEKCWNEKRGLCKQCAPDLGVEMSAAQASRSVQEVWAHACMAEEDKPLGAETWKETIRATCPSCNEPLEGKVKFCPSCGAKIDAEAHCTQCGAKLPVNSKFCPECGAKSAG